MAARKPALPTVVCPPPSDVTGDWSVTTTDDGLEARFTAEGHPEQLLGFVLQGKAVSQRQALAAQIPPLWI